MSAAMLAAALLLGVDTWAAPTAASIRTDSAFNSELSANYMALSHAEYAQGDERDGGTYAARGQAAAQGQPGDPDLPALHQAFLKEHYVSELTDARGRLMKSFAAGGRGAAPAAAARAQSSYDCWLEQASEDLQQDDIAACRGAFLVALAAVEPALATTAVAPPVSATTVAVTSETAAPAARVAPTQTPTYRVFFEFDSTVFVPESAAVLAEVKAAADRNPAGHIVAVGHASTIGDATHNQALSERRAEAVKRALVARDIEAVRIAAEGRGEGDLLVPTADGVREPRNRQVYITIE